MATNTKLKPDVAYFDAMASVDSIEWYGLASTLHVGAGLKMSPEDIDRYNKASEALKAAVTEYLEKNVSKILKPFME